jgi:uncharacterized cupredoxin-like copper-binding protein
MQIRRQLAQVIQPRIHGRSLPHGSRVPDLLKSRYGIVAAVVFLVLGTLCNRAPAADAIANVNWSTAEIVNVVMTEYTFTPSVLRFRRGVAYRMHLENPGNEMHEWTSPSFFKTIQMKNPEVLVEAGNEIVLQPKEQKDLYFVPKQSGRYELTCSDHDWAGMTGEIIVE